MTPSTVEASSAISLEDVMAYRHPEIVQRIAQDVGVSHDEAEGIFKETKRFLYLCAITEG